MPPRMDADDRVTLIFGQLADARPGDAVLYDGARGDAVPSKDVPVASFAPDTTRNTLIDHSIGCRCCGGRDPAALALAGLFLARARGEVGYFSRVVVDVGDVSLVRAMLEHDLFVRARFRLS